MPTDRSYRKELDVMNPNPRRSPLSSLLEITLALVLAGILLLRGTPGAHRPSGSRFARRYGK